MAEATTTAKGTTDAAAAATPETTPKAEPAAPPAGETTAKTGTTESTPTAAAVKGTAVPAGPPEKYALTVPDAGKVYIDDADMQAFEKQARSLGWTNAEAQAALTEHVDSAQEIAAGFLETTKADPDYGGEKLAETQRLAKLGIDLLRPEGHARRPAFIRLLDKMGASNHIEIISALADLGRRASEDAPGQTSSAQLRGQKTAEQILYDKTPPQG